MFEDIDILKNSIALLINKASKKRDVKCLREGFIDEIKITDEKAKKVIEFTKNSTFKFDNIEEEGEVSTGCLFENIYQQIKYINLKE